MVAQLNRFMALFVLCGLLTRPAMAAPDSYQTLVVNGDTLVVQMAEPLPTGYQTIVVDGDSLTVQVLAEPLPTDDPPLPASDDSLSVQIKTMETSPQAAVGDSASTTGRADRHLLNSVFMGDSFRPAAAVSDSTERVGRRGLNQILAMLGGAVVGGLGGGMLGLMVGGTLYRDCEGTLCGFGIANIGGLGMAAGAMIGIVLAANPPDQAKAPNKSDEAHQVSIGLVPDPKGGLSAIATLRF